MVAQIHTVHKKDTNIDLNIMSTDREILEQNRDELEHRIKDLFIYIGIG